MTTPTSARQQICDYLTALPSDADADLSGLSTRIWVADLALTGVLVGCSAGLYPPEETWWWPALFAVADQTGLPRPVVRPGDIDPRWDEFPLEDDSPLLDATLQLLDERGTQDVDLPDVAHAAEVDRDWLCSMYTGMDDLLDELVDLVLSDGFDDLSPLHVSVSEAGVRSLLQVLASSERTACLLRLLVLAGVRPTPEAVAEVREQSPLVGPQHADLTPGARIAALAVDGWALTSGSSRSAWAQELPAALVDRLRAMSEG